MGEGARTEDCDRTEPAQKTGTGTGAEPAQETGPGTEPGRVNPHVVGPASGSPPAGPGDHLL